MLLLFLILTLCTSVSLTATTLLFQFLIYPLFYKVSSFDFECYFKKFLMQSMWILFPVFILDILFTVLLPFLSINSHLITPLLLSYGMMVFTYFSFLLIQVPLNLQLKEGQNPVIINKLIKYNWIGVISCVIRTLIFILILSQLYS